MIGRPGSGQGNAISSLLPIRSRRSSVRGVLTVALLLLLAPVRWASGELEFPDDHGPHPDFRMESWYFSGRLSADANQEFGFHLGFFRLGVEPDSAEQANAEGSAWRIREIYRAELGIADLKNGRFLSAERLSRAALDLAGAQASPFKVWVYDWAAQADQDQSSEPVFKLHATRGDEGRLELELKAAKPAIVPRGQPGMGGRSPRSDARWYSLTRMVAAGTLTLDGRVHQVKGHAWLDRLWRDASFDFVAASLASADRTGFFSAGQIAVNRFALVLENGWELLLFQMHRRDGSGVPIASGTLIYGDGSLRELGRDELAMSESGHWTSDDGARYPAAWRIEIPADGIKLAVTASAPDQEVRETVRYWAGAVDISGEAIGRPVAGHGHAALTGYAGRRQDLP